MERSELTWLRNWKESTQRKPLIIRGARQVGKTWLMREFGRREYAQTAYVNFESNSVLKNLFTGDFQIKRILTAIRIETGIDIDPRNTLIIFDEIQEARGALTSLKYFQENAPEYHIVSAGSLLGVAISGNSSFPVGKVDFLDLHPLTFTEFLKAIDEYELADLLNSKDWSLISAFRPKFIDRLKQYYFIGGMPEVVLSFSGNASLTEVRRIQKNILIAYEQDFSKHAPKDQVPRIRMVWNAIPAQLAKENRKFMYSLLKQGARAKEYEMAIAWLVDSGLLHKVKNVSKPGFPLKAYEEQNTFKLFICDVGLLAAMTNIDAKTLLDENRLFTEFKGALTEQYVFQQICAQKDALLYYWSPGSSAELDFLVQYDGEIIPVEVKASENLRAKSLKVYVEKYQPHRAIRTSMSDYRKEAWMINIPLYAIHTLL